MENLVESIQLECGRLREELLPVYDKIKHGQFAAMMMRKSIQVAEEAIAEGDAVKCVAALRDLRGYQL